MGYVYKRVWPSGKIRFIIAYQDVDGRTKRRVVKAETKLVAKRLLAQAENEVERAKLQGMDSRDVIIAPLDVITLRKAADDYMKRGALLKKESSRERDQYALDNHLLSVFGSRALKDITIRDVESYITTRLASDSGRGTGKTRPATVLNEIHTLSAIFRYSIRSGWVQFNPVRDAQKPKQELPILRYLSREEEEALLVRARTPLREAIITAIHSGMREEEQCALTWPDVRFAENKIIVRHTKNGRDRAVDMSATLRATLEGMVRFTECPYVFVSQRTRDRYERFNNTAWRQALVDSGIKNLRWHDLRHTFGSRLAQAGVHPKTIQELMGHSSLDVTMRYMHVAPDNRAAAVRMLDAKPLKKQKAQ